MIIFCIFIFFASSSYGFKSNIGFFSPIREKSCTGPNFASSGIKKTSNFGKTYGNCINFSCISNYQISGQSCVPSIITQSCSPLNSSSAGSQTSNDGGSSFSSCTGFTCNSGYSVSGSSCVLSLVANVVCGGNSTNYMMDSFCTSANYYQQTITGSFSTPFGDATVNLLLAYKFYCGSNVTSMFNAKNFSYIFGSYNLSIPIYYFYNTANTIASNEAIYGISLKSIYGCVELP